MKLMLNGKEVTGMGHYVMAGDIKDATAEDSNVLSGKAYYNNNGKREGTMPNRGGMSAELSAGGSVSIQEGYHDGTGSVRAQDLASQTAGDAGAGDIASGKTAWVNGEQVTGSLSLPSTVTGTYTKSGTPSFAGSNIYMKFTVTEDVLLKNGAVISLYTAASDFGNATKANVDGGRTFTSSAGLKVTGIG